MEKRLAFGHEGLGRKPLKLPQMALPAATPGSNPPWTVTETFMHLAATGITLWKPVLSLL